MNIIVVVLLSRRPYSPGFLISRRSARRYSQPRSSGSDERAAWIASRRKSDFRPWTAPRRESDGSTRTRSDRTTNGTTCRAIFFHFCFNESIFFSVRSPATYSDLYFDASSFSIFYSNRLFLGSRNLEC